MFASLFWYFLLWQTSLFSHWSSQVEWKKLHSDMQVSPNSFRVRRNVLQLWKLTLLLLATSNCFYLLVSRCWVMSPWLVEWLIKMAINSDWAKQVDVLQCSDWTPISHLHPLNPYIYQLYSVSVKLASKEPGLLPAFYRGLEDDFWSPG